MRNIQKHPEPKSLTQHRCNINTDYDNYAEKDDLRSSLVSEQQGICCYCMQRIYTDSESMKIEHWQSQDRYPHRQLEYKNLLGACRGGEGQKPTKQHCDTKKGNIDLTFNPADPAHDLESKIRFLGDGTVESRDIQFDREINEVLNLNEGTLVRNRKAVLAAFRQFLIQNNPSDSDLCRELSKWNGDNSENLEPFCQVVVYYLRKKIDKNKNNFKASK
jgi:uncharacterized protein (TIGR02646 family)